VVVVMVGFSDEIMSAFDKNLRSSSRGKTASKQVVYGASPGRHCRQEITNMYTGEDK
jgi:hypothetical protein